MKIESQTEKLILKECIGLLQEITDCFKQYLDFIGYTEPQFEEEKGCFVSFSYFHLVNRLFLFHTNHCGGNSTRAKCQELGINDSSSHVDFYLWEEDD